MERLKKKKEKKVRVQITIDESIYFKYGLYIDNLSSFLNKTLKNYIEKQEKELLPHEDSSNVGYVQFLKEFLAIDDHKRKDYPEDSDELVKVAKTNWIRDFDE